MRLIRRLAHVWHLRIKPDVLLIHKLLVMSSLCEDFANLTRSAIPTTDPSDVAGFGWVEGELSSYGSLDA